MESFFAQYGLFILLAVLLVFMIFSTRRRNQRMQAEQQEKQRQTVPGARVLMQGGLYGTVVSFDSENLDQPARVEIAPGVIIDVHSQAVIRVVTPEEDAVTPLDDTVSGQGRPGVIPPIETPEETRARLERERDDK